MGLGVAARPDPRPRPRPRARIRSVLRELAALGVFLLDGITGRGRRCCHEAMMGAGPGRSSEEANVSHAVCRARARARDPRASMHACVSVCACVACTAGRAGVRAGWRPAGACPSYPTTTGHGRPGTVHCTGLQISRGDERVAGTCPCPRLSVRILFSHLSAVDRWRVAVRFFFLLFFIGRLFSRRARDSSRSAGVIAVHLNFCRPGFAYYRGGGGGILYSAVLQILPPADFVTASFSVC